MGLDLNSWLTYKGMTLEIIVWSMFLGIVAGAFIILYNKNVLGAFVRKLVDIGACTPESAKTLEETGFTKNIFVKFSLNLKGTYRRIIVALPSQNKEIPASGAIEPEKKKRRQRRLKLSELKFYIPQEMKDRADSFYNNSGANLLIVIMTIALFLTVAILSFTIVPDLVQMLKNFMEFISPIE